MDKRADMLHPDLDVVIRFPLTRDDLDTMCPHTDRQRLVNEALHYIYHNVNYVSETLETTKVS